MAFASRDVFGFEMAKNDIKKLDEPTRLKIHELVFVKYIDNLEPNLRLMEKYAHMRANGYDFMIVSARSKQFIEEAKYSMDLYNVKYDEIVLSDSDWERSAAKWKAGIVKKHIVDYDEILFFDDKIDNINELKKSIAHNRIRYFLVDRSGEKEI